MTTAPQRYRIITTHKIKARGDGRYEARLTLLDLHTGKKKIESFYGNLKREAKSKREQFVIDLENPLPLGGEKLLIAEWMDEWLNVYKSKSVRDGTFAKYANYIKLYITPTIGDQDCRYYSTPEAQEFLNGLSPRLEGKQINEVRMLLNAAFNKAVDMGHLVYNPFDKTSRAKERHHEVIVMTIEEEASFLQAAKDLDSQFLALYQTGLLTGMRPGELYGLLWSNVDFKQNLIYVRQAVTVIDGKPTVGDVKTKAGLRSITMSSSLQTILKAYRAKHSGHGYVFSTRNGTALNPSNVRRDITRVCKYAGIDNFSPKDFRSTFATRGAAAGVNPKILMYIMGHSNVSVTLKYYTKATPQMVRDAIEQIENLTKYSSANNNL